MYSIYPPPDTLRPKRNVISSSVRIHTVSCSGRAAAFCVPVPAEYSTADEFTRCDPGSLSVSFGRGLALRHWAIPTATAKVSTPTGLTKCQTRWQSPPYCECRLVSYPFRCRRCSSGRVPNTPQHRLGSNPSACARHAVFSRTGRRHHFQWTLPNTGCSL
jgi:hypothetical protein